MRLRNIPRAESVIDTHTACIRQEEQQYGKWDQVFQNENPIHIEIGMGKGRFLLTLAKRYPEINYIGIERYASVLLRAIEKFDTEEFGRLSNIRFICMDAVSLPEVFAPGEVNRVYLNFSDPWPKDRHAKRRLTSTQFLERYDSILAAGGTVEFKTDNRGLFDFSLEQAGLSTFSVLAATFDLHREEMLSKENVMTEYEEKFSGLGHPICKMILGRK